MKFKSQIFTQVSGSVGGLTFGSNRGGLYTRARAIPTNPNTAAQVAARDAMSTLVDSWTNILTPTQRTSWATYALNTPVIDVFGDAKKLTGQQMYIRSNQPRIRNAIARRDDAPVIFDLGTFTGPSMVISAASPFDIVVSFDNSDSWAIASGGHLVAGASRGQNPSKNFFKSPFQTMGTIVGDPTPPVSPATLTSPFTYAEGQKVFATFRASQGDGRLSTPQIIDTIVTA